MLDKIREGSQGWVAQVILGVVVLTFALAGVGSYLGSSSAPVAATVNGEEITKSDFEQRYQAKRAQMERQFGQMFEQLAADEKYMQSFRQSTLDELIVEELEKQLAEELGLRFGDEALKNMIREMPQFQVDGKFNNDQYLAWMRQAGYQPDTLRDAVYQSAVLTQLRQSVQSTDFALPGEVNAFNQLDKQTRDIEYVVFKSDDFKDKVSLSDDEKSAYYEQNLERFRTQEMVSVEYVELKVEDIAKTIAVSDEDVEKYYQDNISNYRTSDASRRASHILVEFGDDEDAAKAKAQALLERIKAGEDFAAVAKEASEDTFSGEKGGDLEWFEKGVMGDDFDAVVFAMKAVGDVSEVFRSESGFHIAKLTGDKGEVITPFAEVKEKVADALKTYRANEIFTDKQTQLAELAFEVPDSLHDAAEAIGAQVKETAFFSRFNAPAAVNFPAVVQAAFSDVVLQEQVNSDLLDVNDGHVMVIRLKQHQPSRIQDQQEVTAQIEQILTQQKAQELAEQEAKSLLEQLDGNNMLSQDAATKALTIVAKNALERFSADVDSTIRADAFKMPHPAEGKVSAEVISMSSGDIALVTLNKVTDGAQPEDVKPVEQRLASQSGRTTYKSFVETLKANAEIYKEGEAKSE